MGYHYLRHEWLTVVHRSLENYLRIRQNCIESYQAQAMDLVFGQFHKNRHICLLFEAANRCPNDSGYKQLLGYQQILGAYLFHLYYIRFCLSEDNSQKLKEAFCIF